MNTKTRLADTTLDELKEEQLLSEADEQAKKAYARLRAAAPYMLKALELLEAVDFGANGSVEQGAWMARIALAKVREG
jgi:hypothetical protein